MFDRNDLPECLEKLSQIARLPRHLPLLPLPPIPSPSSSLSLLSPLRIVILNVSKNCCRSSVSRGGYRREHSISRSRGRERARDLERIGKDRDIDIKDDGVDQGNGRGGVRALSPWSSSARELGSAEEQRDADTAEFRRRLAALHRERARELHEEQVLKRRLEISYTAPCTPVDCRCVLWRAEIDEIWNRA